LDIFAEKKTKGLDYFRQKNKEYGRTHSQ